jgi:hypothetical protein
MVRSPAADIRHWPKPVALLENLFGKRELTSDGVSTEASSQQSLLFKRRLSLFEYDYAVACWAVFFLGYYVLMRDLPHFYHFVFDGLVDTHRLLGIPFNEALGYYGALVVTTFLYGFMTLAMRCKRISAFRIEMTPGAKPVHRQR